MAKRKDPQLTGMAGEFLTVGKLFKRGLQASVTLGNAKSVDILAYNSTIDKNYNIQVKTLRYKNYFPIKKEDIHGDHIYVFVLLNEPEIEEEFYILKGETILENINGFFGTSYTKEKPSSFPGIYWKSLLKFKNNWKLFNE